MTSTPIAPDLEPYVQLVDESLAARRVLDIGCGTGTFCCLLAQRGVEVIGVDPAAASLEVARSKPGADGVRWLHADAVDLLNGTDDWAGVDLVTMTANVAQVFLTDSEWASVLHAAWNALRPGGHRCSRPGTRTVRAWREWTRERSQRQTAIPEVGVVETWVERHRTERTAGQLSLDLHLPGRRGHPDVGYHAAVSRPRGDREFLIRGGFDRVAVRDAADRPGREFVVLARRPGPDGPA